MAVLSRCSYQSNGEKADTLLVIASIYEAFSCEVRLESHKIEGDILHDENFGYCTSLAFIHDFSCSSRNYAVKSLQSVELCR
jgi:hypothetical protein